MTYNASWKSDATGHVRWRRHDELAGETAPRDPATDVQFTSNQSIASGLEGAGSPALAAGDYYGSRYFPKLILHEVHEDCNRNQAANHAKALRIVQKYCGPADPAQTLQRITSELQNARLTTALNLQRFNVREYIAANCQYQNCFRPGQSERNKSYLELRDSVEQALFNLSALFRQPHGEYGQRSIRTGVFKTELNEKFAPASRPSYGSLEIPCASASQYGKTLIEYSDVVKHNCTFTAGDSFNTNSDPSNKACDFYHLENLLVHAKRPGRMGEAFGQYNFSRNMVNWVLGRKVALPQEGMLDYIDAQIHGPVPLELIEHIHLSMAELSERLGGRQDVLQEVVQSLERVNQTSRAAIGRDFFRFR